MLQDIFIDIETFSSESIKNGVYKYAASADFEILIISYQFDDGVLVTIDLKAPSTPERESQIKFFKAWLLNKAIVKHAHNAIFERVCFSKWLGVTLDPSEWRCTSVKAGIAGVPLGLDGASSALNVTELKDKAGDALIRTFSIPIKPSKANGMITRITPTMEPFKWMDYKDYNRQDVRAERAVYEATNYIPISKKEQILYTIDQRINDRGVRVDIQFAKNMIELVDRSNAVNIDRAYKIAGIANVGSAEQVKDFISGKLGRPVKDLTKKAVEHYLKTDIPYDVRQILNIRQAIAKTSTAKYHSMLAFAGSDDRARGLFQFYGASRTGRWAGRGVQLQNLPKIEIAGDISKARELAFTDLDYAIDTVTMLYGNANYYASQMVRPAFIPRPGGCFAILDFKSIEAIVLAWMAGEQWKLDAFAEGRDLYLETVSRMFGIPMTDIEALMKLRSTGKTLELGCGYQGGEKALIKGGAIEKGLKEDETPGLVKAWRRINPHIVSFWYDLQRAAISAVQGETTYCKGLKLFMSHGNLFIKLLSGRCLCYYKARLTDGMYGPQVSFMGTLDMAGRKVWGLKHTYGGSLVENVIQATARDLLCEAMIKAEHENIKTVITVHDEIVAEGESEAKAERDLARLLDIAKENVPWAKGLKLIGDGKISDFYTK